MTMISKIALNRICLVRLGIGLLALILVLFPRGGRMNLARAETGEQLEYLVKAAFLYNFMKFVEWPKTAFKGDNAPIRVYVFGASPFGPALDSVQGKKVGARTVRITVGEDLSAAETCQMLFIARSSPVPFRNILDRVKDKPVLTVADTEGFCEAGGGIKFLIAGNKVRFEINQSAAKRAGLKVSSQLLKLAIIREE